MQPATASANRMPRMLDAILHGPDASRHRLALLRHESKIASAGLRAIARKPLDLLTVVVALPVGLLVMRAWTSGQPQQLLALQAFAVGFLVAFYCAMGLLHRCNYPSNGWNPGRGCSARRGTLGVRIATLRRDHRNRFRLPRHRERAPARAVARGNSSGRHRRTGVGAPLSRTA